MNLSFLLEIPNRHPTSEIETHHDFSNTATTNPTRTSVTPSVTPPVAFIIPSVQAVQDPLQRTMECDDTVEGSSAAVRGSHAPVADQTQGRDEDEIAIANLVKTMRPTARQPESLSPVKVTSKPRNSICRVCMEPFGHQEHLIRHDGFVHKKCRPFWCEICEAKFVSKHNRKVHTNSRRHRSRVIKRKAILNLLTPVELTNVSKNSPGVREAVEQKALPMEAEDNALTLSGARPSGKAAATLTGAETPIRAPPCEPVVMSEGDAENHGKH